MMGGRLEGTLDWSRRRSPSEQVTLVEFPVAITESTAERYTLADPDVRLMLLVRDDDPRAFEELMLRYQNRVVALLAHLTGQPDLAEDLAQDVFLRVYRARKRYVPGAKFSTWLFTIAGNVAANAQRSRSRRQEVNLPPSTSDTTTLPIEAMAVAASGLMPTRQVDNAEMRAAVQQAISTLGERQRMAVLLAKFEHFSYAEIAEVMDLTPEAVKSLLSRAADDCAKSWSPILVEERESRVESLNWPTLALSPQHTTIDVHYVHATHPTRCDGDRRSGRVPRRRIVGRRLPADRTAVGERCGLSPTTHGIGAGLDGARLRCRQPSWTTISRGRRLKWYALRRSATRSRSRRWRRHWKAATAGDGCDRDHDCLSGVRGHSILRPKPRPGLGARLAGSGPLRCALRRRRH